MNKKFMKNLHERSIEPSKLSAAKLALLEKRLRGKGAKEREEQTPARHTAGGTVPLSASQQRLWFLEQLEGESAAYNIPFGYLLTGPLNTTALERSINEIVRRHDALRTAFTAVNGKPEGMVVPKAAVPLLLRDLHHLAAADRETAILRQIHQQTRQRFDLSTCPLFRVMLLQVDDGHYLFVMTIHHIVYDGWSMGVFMRELTAIYAAFFSGRPSPLPELSVQYADFALWQHKRLHGGELERQMEYWKQRLAGLPPALALPTDRPRPAKHSFQGALHTFSLPKTLTDALKIISRQETSTLFMSLLAAFAILLYRYTGQHDIVVGSPVANRQRSEFEHLIGFFVNTLVLRINIKGDPSFRQLLNQVRTITLEAHDHQDLPFDLLVAELHPDRDLSHQPLFQVAFALQNVAMEPPEFPGVSLETLTIHNETTKFDLSCRMIDTEQDLLGSIEYNSNLFEPDRIARMAGHFHTLLEGLIAAPERSISTFPLLTEQERQQIVVEWNATRADYPQNACLHELFEAQAERTPDAIAVVFEEQQLTYRALNRKANQLAHYLHKLGVGPEVLVGICMERSKEIFVAILGVLKAGGAYVPLNPSYRQERLNFMLEDIQVLLTQQKLLAEFPTHQVHTVCLDRDWIPNISVEPTIPVKSRVLPKNLAYVIYTSGSTGQPKGVAIQHSSVINLLYGLYETIYANHRKSQLRVSLNGPLAFDTSVKQIIQLLHGHLIEIIPELLRFDAKALLSYLRRRQIDIFDCTPSQLSLLLSEGLLNKSEPAPQSILIGGEPINESTWEILAQAEHIHFYNVYGPTECTVDATLSHVQNAPDKPVIGHPIMNTKTYILDDALQPVPIGVPGELYISGDGLARGYLKDPGMTGKKFLPDPFSDEPGSRLYKTGDRGRYLSDGTIEFLGRNDTQVKLRGFRIELGEIEAVLKRHPDVQEAVVVVHENIPGNKRLAAYVIPDLKHSPTIAGRQRYILPNNLAIACVNQDDADALYQKIFEVQAYLKHGITINDGDCIFDVGANIGLFTLFAHLKNTDVRLYSFDPNPAAFELLRLNTLLYGGNTTLFHCALSGKSHTATLTFPPQDTMSPGLYADEQEEKEEWFGETVTSNIYVVQHRTLSEIIEEHKVERIDLLKITAEKSELDVFNGIQDEHWNKIRQIVMEVHDTAAHPGRIKGLLKAHGYHFTVEQDWLQERAAKTTFYVYAWRESDEVIVSLSSGREHPGASLPALPDPILSSEELRRFLQQKLPDYMIPSTCILLEQFPLTPNGKVDRRALPDPDAQRDDPLIETYVAPRSHDEHVIADLWTELIGIEQISVYENFFDVGGHSLLGMQLISQLSNALHLTIPVEFMFSYRTIASMAEGVEELRQNARLTELPSVPGEEAISEGKAAVSWESRFFQRESRPLLSLFVTRKLAPVISAALDYIPTSLLRRTGLSREEMLMRWCDNVPTVFQVSETQWGRIGGVMLPVLDSDLFSDPSGLVNTIVDALEIAKLLGARVVTLTGLLAAATDYGRAIVRAINNRDLPAISTGHAAISSAFLFNLEQLLQEGKRDLAQERAAFIDLTSLGTTILRLMLRCLPHPKEILLCDFAHKRDLLENTRRRLLSECNFRGKIRVIPLQTQVSPELYDATVFISAFNIPGMLDISRVKAGALLVGTTSFGRAQVIKRFQEQEDILFTFGGALRLPHPVEELAYIPHEIQHNLSPAVVEAFNSKSSLHDIPACAFSSLLTARFKDLGPTVGIADEYISSHYYEFLKQSGIQGAALHDGNYVLPADSIQNFRRRFGNA